MLYDVHIFKFYIKDYICYHPYAPRPKRRKTAIQKQRLWHEVPNWKQIYKSTKIKKNDFIK